ncbi:50S ribosomal protein L6, partial [candidate division MSBL1 archaeon SCGC-AAA382A20]
EKLSREFDILGILIEENKDEIIVKSDSSKKRSRASVGTVVSHIKNMIEGVTEGFTSRLKIVYSHFPITVNVASGKVKIENFIGEEEPRYAEIVGGTEVEIKDDEIELTGFDKEEVGQTAANIEQSARVRDRDLRVFQDGIYIIERP